MINKLLVLAAIFLWLPSSRAFQRSIGPNQILSYSTSLSASNDDVSRRRFFQNIATSSIAVGTMIAFGPQSMAHAASPKVLVLGGTGFVGSRVVKKLQDMGIEVLSTSRDGRDGTIALDVSTPGLDVMKTVEEIAKGCTAVISTIGSIGTDQDLTVNSATGLAALGAKAAQVNQFVYISVAPEVKEFAKNIDFLKPYMTGKSFSQDAVISNFAKATLIEPTFVYGGDSFNLNPPRVAGFYGEFIEALLSSGPIRAITNIAPEGLIKIALEPPVSVDTVAKAAVAGALGKTDTVLDTYDKIVRAATLI